VSGTAVNSAGVSSRDGSNDLEGSYPAIALDPRYGHYLRIPERICRCLDYFKISCNRAAVKKRLLAYYLFIGVADDAIDLTGCETGRDILKLLEKPNPGVDAASRALPVGLVTEMFRAHLSPDARPAILARFDELYHAVLSERKATTMAAYIEQRKAIGWLTAEISYLLIRPLLLREHPGLRPFLQRVGAVGCLMDSIIDLRADVRLGLIRFQPTLRDQLQLGAELLCEGLDVLRKSPRLLWLFLEAVVDNVLDFHVRRDGHPPSPVSRARVEVPGSCPALQIPGS